MTVRTTFRETAPSSRPEKRTLEVRVTFPPNDFLPNDERLRVLVQRALSTELRREGFTGFTVIASKRVVHGRKGALGEQGAGS
jgi:hypothetical protein